MPHAVMGCKPSPVALAFLLFHVLLGASSAVTFESEPPLTKGYVGDDIIMEWTLSSDLADFSLSSFVKDTTVLIIRHAHGGADTPGTGYEGRVLFYSTSSRGTGFRLTDVTLSDAGRYRCQYEYPQQIESSLSVLFIFDEPSTPEISLKRYGQISDPFTGDLVEGGNVTLLCAASSTSRPAADRPAMTYAWTRNGQPIDRDNPPDRHSVPNATGRRLDINPVSRDDVTYGCTAREEGSNLNSQTTRNLNVLYPPGAATAPDPPPSSVVQGTSLTVTCTLSDPGNPPARVVYRPPNEYSPTVTDNRLVISAVTLERDDGTWGCYGENTAGTARQATFDITVHVPPRVAQNLPATKDIDITQTLSVSCSFEGRPAPAIQWTYGGSAVLPDAVETVPGSASTKGKLVTSSSTLQWKTASDAKRRLAGGVYRCTATNAAGTVKSRKMTLDAQYAPYSVTVTPSSPVKTVEGERLVLEGSADCNPSCQYSWTLNGDSLTQDTSGRLQIDSIRRDKHGTYSVRAHNDLGSLAETVEVTVNYPPTVTMTIDPEDGSRGDRVQILCDVDSRPPSQVTWTNLTSSVIPNGTVSAGQRQHTLVLNPADCLDSGTIRCAADNGIGSAASKEREVNVFCPPRLDPAESRTEQQAVLLDDPATFEVYVIANPAPVSWTYTLTTENGSTYDNDVKGVTLSPSGNPGNLTIASVQPHHYGDYDVTVTNDKGQPLVIQLKLQTKGPPESPEKFEVRDVTCAGVTLQWEAGFSGGSAQTFHLSYRKSGATEWVTLTVEDSGQDIISHKVNNLQEQTVYEFKLYAQNADGSTEDKALRSTPETTACPKFVPDSLVISVEDNIATISWEFTERVDRVDVTCCNDPGVCTERTVDQPTAQQPITMEVPPGNQNYIFTFKLFQDGELVFSMEKKHGPGSNLGVIIGAVVAVILVVALLVVIFVLFRKGVLPLKGADYSRSFEGELEAYAVATAKPRPNANANKPEKPKKSEKPEKPKKSAKPKKTDAPPVLVTDIYSEVQKPKKGPKPASGGAVGSTDTGPVLYAEVTKKPKNKERTSQDGGAKSDSTPKDTDAGPVNGKVQKKPPAAENGKQAPNAKGYVNAAWTEGPEGPYSNVATHSGVAAAGGEGEGAYSEVAPKKKPGLLKSKPKAKPKPKAELPARAKGADNNNQGAAAPLVDEGVYQNVTSGGPAPVEDENFNPYSDVASEAHPEEPDAMVYADLSFAAAAAAAAAAAPGGGEGGGEGEGQPQKAPRIHRREEPTEYATVDFTRTGKYKAN